MYQTIKRLFDRTHNIDIVRNAVKKGWITEEQYMELTGEKYEVEGG